GSKPCTKASAAPAPAVPKTAPDPPPGVCHGGGGRPLGPGGAVPSVGRRMLRPWSGAIGHGHEVPVADGRRTQPGDENPGAVGADHDRVRGGSLESLVAERE